MGDAERIPPRAAGTSHTTRSSSQAATIDPAAVPLLGPATATPAQALAMAREAGAARMEEVSAFVAELWRLGVEAGYDPAVVFAQFCLETGTGTSPAWRERLNPAGLGIGDVTDEGIGFRNGTEAAQAMLVHLSAYVRGYDPHLWRYLPLDPRYLAPLRAGYGGTVTTLADLGNGRWATDPDYAAKIARRLETLRSRQVGEPASRQEERREPAGGSREPAANSQKPEASAQHPSPANIVWIGTPNWHARTDGQEPVAIVYHVTDDLVFEHVRTHFTNPASRASAHFVVGRDGTLWQFVATRHAAWTNGDFAGWRQDIPWLNAAIARCYHATRNPNGRMNLNDFCCSIEFMGKPGMEFTPAQFVRAVEITRYLLGRYPGIRPNRGHLLRHADINSVSRPYCPGPTFPLGEVIEAVGGDAAVMG